MEGDEMIHYHGTPITPNEILLKALRGRHFCVSYIRPDQLNMVKIIGQSLMFDNGAYSAWKTGKKLDWNKYYNFVEANLNIHTDFAVIPDIIDGTEEDNNTIMRQWPFSKDYGAPVWHLHESYKRLHTIAYLGYRRICFGSSGEFAKISTYLWLKRIEDAFNMLCPNGGQPPVAIHMLRGLSLSGSAFPFSSADSTNIARNHNKFNSIGEVIEMANRIDGANCPSKWCTTRFLDSSFSLDKCNWDELWQKERKA